MRIPLLVTTGLLTLCVFLPAQADAASPYCAERICHSYDSNGACNNYTCVSDYRYSYSRDYRYENRNSYCEPYRTGWSYYDDCSSRSYRTSDSYSTSRRYYYDGVYNVRYPTSYSSRGYYYDYGTYWDGRRDVLYAPSAGYYYRD